MKTTFSKFFKKTSSQLDRMRQTINKLKETQEEQEQLLAKAPKRQKSKKDEMVVHLSPLSVAKATLVVIGLVVLTNFLGQIADIIVVFFVSVLFSAALDPTVDLLQRYRVPRALSVLVIFLIILTTLGFFISQLVPLVASQIIELASGLGDIINKMTEGEANYLFAEYIQGFISETLGSSNSELVLQQVAENLQTLGKQLQSIAGDTFVAIKGIFNGILNFFMVLILTFFLVVDEKKVDSFFISLFPSKHGTYIVEKLEAVKIKVGLWLRGQVILMFLMFMISWIAFSLLGLEYALTLAMLAGIGELIPVVGVFIAAIPALLVAFNQSPWVLLWAFIAIIVIQQIEGNVLVPVVMKKAVGLSPIVVILAMLVGYQVLGILGMIIAIPATTILSIFVLDYTTKKK